MMKIAAALAAAALFAGCAGSEKASLSSHACCDQSSKVTVKLAGAEKECEKACDAKKDAKACCAEKKACCEAEKAKPKP